MSNPNLDNNSNLGPTETKPTAPMDLDTARRIEQEKLTRRAALRKLGFGAGIAAFSLLGVDDFAHMVGKRLERMAGDNKVAGQVAKEFQSAGIALAGGPSWGGCDGCIDNCVAPKYFRCNPCTVLVLCTGSTIGPDNCSKYTVGANKSDCYTCCGAVNALNNLLEVGAYYACRALC